MHTYIQSYHTQSRRRRCYDHRSKLMFIWSCLHELGGFICTTWPGNKRNKGNKVFIAESEYHPTGSAISNASTKLKENADPSPIDGDSRSCMIYLKIRNAVLLFLSALPCESSVKPTVQFSFSMSVPCLHFAQKLHCTAAW